ncbi:hypothetical protein ES705_26748 [subsurface metagenome]
MKKLIKIGLLLFGIGILSATGTYLYVFHKPHRNIAKEKPSYIIDAVNFYDEFIHDEEESYLKYGDKVIQVSGEVVEFNLRDNGASLVYLNPLEGVNCSFDSTTVIRYNDKLSDIDVGDRVTVKGKCDGFDFIMGVVLTRCVLIEKQEYLSSIQSVH